MPEVSEPVIVDTSPLIALSSCGQIELLRSLHPRVVVPEAVVAELERGRSGAGPFGVDVLLPEWIEVLSLHQPPSPLLQAHLDEGEAAVITLALELSFLLVVIDERRGRMVARTMGLAVTGSVGILLRAKREGLLSAVRPCFEAMRAHGIWLSERLVTSALQEVGEE